MKESKNDWVRYTSMSMELLAGNLIFLFLGKFCDHKLGMPMPVFVWVFPMLFILFYLIRLYKDISKTK